jgi:hypothetical protein
MRNRDADAYLFSPREAEEARRRKATAARRTPLDRGNRVGTNRRPESPRVLGDRYDSSVHGQATAGRSRERARRRSRRRRTSSPRARPRYERGARPTLSWANTASTPASPHRRHADSTGVRRLFDWLVRCRDARAFKRLHDHGSPTRSTPNATCNAWPRSWGGWGGRRVQPKCTVNDSRCTPNATPPRVFQRTGSPRRRIRDRGRDLRQQSRCEATHGGARPCLESKRLIRPGSGHCCHR